MFLTVLLIRPGTGNGSKGFNLFGLGRSQMIKVGEVLNHSLHVLIRSRPLVSLQSGDEKRRDLNFNLGQGEETKVRGRGSAI